MSAPTRAARMITQPQQRKLHALYRDLGMDRPMRLADMTIYLGQEVTSSKHLSMDEAKLLIDHLERLAA